MSPLLIGAMGGAVVAVAYSALARGKPHALTADGGAIGPSWIMWGTALGAPLSAAACTYAYVTSGQLPSLLLAIFLGPAGLWVAYTTLPVFHLSWNDEGVTGASSAFFSPQRLTIAWRDVRGFAPTLAGSIRLEATDGRRIYWSRGFSGHALPIQELRQLRPDLS